LTPRQPSLALEGKKKKGRGGNSAHRKAIGKTDFTERGRDGFSEERTHEEKRERGRAFNTI